MPVYTPLCGTDFATSTGTRTLTTSMSSYEIMCFCQEFSAQSLSSGTRSFNRQQIRWFTMHVTPLFVQSLQLGQQTQAARAAECAPRCPGSQDRPPPRNRQRKLTPHHATQHVSPSPAHATLQREQRRQQVTSGKTAEASDDTSPDLVVSLEHPILE